jgi:hypothetical protein
MNTNRTIHSSCWIANTARSHTRVASTAASPWAGFPRFTILLILALMLLASAVLASLSHAAGRVFYDGFEDGTTNKWGQDSGRNRCSVVASAIDGRGPRAGSRMASCNWNGVVAWNDPAAYSTLVLSSWSYSSEFLIRLWVRADNDVDSKFGSKWFRLYNSSNSYYWDGQMEQSGGPIFSTLETYGSTSYGGARVGDRQWHKIEIYVKQGSSSTFRLWVDGNLQHQKTGFSSSTAKWYPMYLMSNWSNNGPAWAHDANNHIYWDEIEIFSDSATGATGLMSDASITQGGSTSSPPAAPSSLTLQ